MKCNKIILLFIILTEYAFSCSCRFTINLDGYDSYKEIKSAFICKIIKRDVINNIEFLDAEVIRSFKGQHEKIIKIQNRSFASHALGCKRNFQTGQTLLMLINRYSGIYYIDECDFTESDKHENFENDTLFFNQFGKLNGLVNLPIAEGQLKNGKQEGVWKLTTRSILNSYVSEIGNYKNGKKEGFWITYFHYDPAKFKLDSSKYYNSKPSEKSSFWQPNIYYKPIFISDSSYYHNNKLNGDNYGFFPNGNIENTSHYKNDKRRGITTAYNEKGVIFSKTKSKAGKTESYVEYRDSSIFEKENNFLKTRMTIYLKDGKHRKKEIIIARGRGKFYEYHDNGKIKTKATFNKEGHLIGSFIIYDDFGKVISTRKLTEDTRLIGDELWNYFPDYENLN